MYGQGLKWYTERHYQSPAPSSHRASIQEVFPAHQSLLWTEHADSSLLMSHSGQTTKETTGCGEGSMLPDCDACLVKQHHNNLTISQPRYCPSLAQTFVSTIGFFFTKADCLQTNSRLKGYLLYWPQSSPDSP